ncbi:hypothetical protein SAMN04487949_2531 [Halogranum gelatinilyticum]|uniref:SipW-cognate class signal peptide n=1 Tax=Halogranum gelatinilyticum TaxID=660521 RepID=A0A1G9VVX4_9EURY|nr:hypothetical protein SAMN04487949_2531 [Halogranum gelatinilyticum]
MIDSESIDNWITIRKISIICVALFVTIAATGVGLFGGTVPVSQEHISTGANETPHAPEPSSTTSTPTRSQSHNNADEASQPENAATTTEPNCGCLDVAFTPTDPDDVTNAEGIVPPLAGELSGSVEWDVPADRVTLVAHTWTPNEEWTERRRTTVEASNDRSLSLSQAFDSTRLFYTEATTPGFANPADASTRTRRGYVSVTAVLYDGDDELDRVAVVEPYEFDVTNTAETAVALDVGGAAETPLLAVEGAAPGSAGDSAVTVSNDGTDDATLSITVSNLVNAENGLIEPERAVDASPDVGELADALELRVALVRGDGSRSYLVGSGNGLLSGPNYVSLSTLATGDPLGSVGLEAGEHAHLVVEWRLPADVGNEIQSDQVSFDVTLGLRTA